MNTQAHPDEGSGAARHDARSAEVYDDENSLKPLVRTIWSYRHVIGVVVAGVMVAFLLAALAAYLRAPGEQTGTLGFRLLFSGASQGRYPNGTAFSSAEITASPVLSEVFDINDLDRFVSFEDFRDSLFILQSNPELSFLVSEYQAILDNPRLRPADRPGFEEEFRTRREGLTDHARFTLNLRQNTRTAAMPPSTVSKVLDDTLATWARQAEELRGASLYNVPVLSTSVLKSDIFAAEETIIGIDVLRTMIIRILRNIDQINTLPGAALIRAGSDRVSLEEARLKLENTLRFEVRPLLGMLRATGPSKDLTALGWYLEDQLFQIAVAREEAQKRVEVIQESLRAYMLQKGTAARESVRGSEGEPVQPGPGDAPGVQLDGGFLNRLVDLSSSSSDIDYRQQLTDRVIDDGVALAALAAEQAYYEEISRTLSNSPSPSGDVDPKGTLLSVTSRFERAFDEVVEVVEHVNAIYEEVSLHNLNPSTLFYTVTNPFTMRSERTLSRRTLGVAGILVLVLSLVVVSLGCLVHSHFRKAIVHTETRRENAGRA